MYIGFFLSFDRNRKSLLDGRAKVQKLISVFYIEISAFNLEMYQNNWFQLKFAIIFETFEKRNRQVFAILPVTYAHQLTNGLEGSQLINGLERRQLINGLERRQLISGLERSQLMNGFERTQCFWKNSPDKWSWKKSTDEWSLKTSGLERNKLMNTFEKKTQWSWEKCATDKWSRNKLTDKWSWKKSTDKWFWKNPMVLEEFT